MPRKAKEATLKVVPKESEPLLLHPEQIIRYLRDNEKLPDDFNPYGNYTPERLRFLGDTKPNTPYHVGINCEDEELIPIFISTPTPPQLDLIEGYKLSPDEQYWRRPEVPHTLKELENRANQMLFDVQKRNQQETVQGYKLYQKFWELLEEEQDKFEEEILWMKHVWWWRIFGYWVYIDGEPTYIPPDYFDYLSFWYIKEAETYPDYRDEDKKKYTFSQYLETTTETFAEINPANGRAVKNEDGTYHMIDTGGRVFFGEMTPKFRRAGETQIGCHKVWKGTSTMLAAFGTIISMGGENAETHYYKKLVPAWNKYPMFLKPIWMGSKRPTSIKLVEPPNDFRPEDEGLGSLISYTDSAGVSANDGDTLHFSLMDEEGKSSVPVFERWNVNKMAMSRGGGTNIIGYSLHPSTVEEMDAGGMEFFKMGQLSCFYERMPVTGQTYSGLARIFIPAYRKLEGFIDRWGRSVIDTPTERQIKFSPRAKFALMGSGAREMLQSQLDSLVTKGTPEALEGYRSRRRKFPMKWADCWLGSSGNVGYNMEILDRRIAELNQLRSLGKMPYREGYYYRENPADKFSRVHWRDDHENSRFKVSLQIPENMTNRMTRSESWDYTRGQMVASYMPVDGYKFTLGVDPFRNINKNDAKNAFKLGGSLSNSRQSDGGLCMLWEYDKSIDGNKPKMDQETDRVVLTYRYRTATWMEFIDDMLMAAQFWGAMLYIEHNVEAIVKEVIDAGFGGFLLFDLDIMTGKPKAMPGRYTGPDTWQEVMKDTKDYIESHGHKENHDDLLLEFKNLKGIEDFTHKDLHAAFGMARLGSKSRYREILSNTNNTGGCDLDGWGLIENMF